MDSQCDQKLNELEANLNGKHSVALRDLATKFSEATNRKIGE